MTNPQTTTIKHIVCFIFWLPAFCWRLFICAAFYALLICFTPLAVLFLCEAIHKGACKGKDFSLGDLGDLPDFLKRVFTEFLIKGEDFPDVQR